MKDLFWFVFKNGVSNRVCMMCIALLTFSQFAVVDAAEWKAGVVSTVITPQESVWMAGYGGRTKPSEGKIHDLYVKALALEDPYGKRAVIVTADLIGLSMEFSNAVARKIEQDHSLPREALLLNTSHTHCGPEVRGFKVPFYGLPEVQTEKLDAYLQWLEQKYVDTISKALTTMRPAEVSFSSVRPTPFAVSRRLPTEEGIAYRSSPSSYYTGGPRDDIMPVLRVADADGSIRAILFGYACHPITLNIYQFCGDYPGFAQSYIEETHPGAVAMFMQGTCGQLVPNARFQIEYAMGHGRALADAVTKALAGEQTPVTGPITCAYEEIPLEFQPAPSREILEEQSKSDNVTQKQKALFLLDQIKRDGKIQTTYQFPFQVIRFGRDILLIGLCGEPVAEYSVKFKSEFLTQKFVWVAGYCNYEFGYLPTWKILIEGGYEGGTAMNHMPFPGPFAESVEKRVCDGVRRLVAKTAGEQ